VSPASLDVIPERSEWGSTAQARAQDSQRMASTQEFAGGSWKYQCASRRADIPLGDSWLSSFQDLSTSKTHGAVPWGAIAARILSLRIQQCLGVRCAAPAFVCVGRWI